MLIDSHAHLDGEKYGSVEKLIENFSSVGGKYIVDVGFDYMSSLAAKERSSKFDGVFFAAGYHPQEADKNNDNGLIEGLLSDKRCVAVGEIGLDRHYLPFDEARQKDLFESQIYLADKYLLPVIIHSRDASKDMLEILRANRSHLKNGFLMHCYSESREQAFNYLDLGAYFAFGGAITFNNAKKDDIVRAVPIDRLFAETDCPYMTPVPFRGQKNEPSLITYVYDKMAMILGVEREYLERAIEANFKRFFKKVTL